MLLCGALVCGTLTSCKPKDIETDGAYGANLTDLSVDDRGKASVNAPIPLSGFEDVTSEDGVCAYQMRAELTDTYTVSCDNAVSVRVQADGGDVVEGETSVEVDLEAGQTVLIEVTECEAVAVIRDETGGKWLINAQCKVLEQVTAETLVDTDGLTVVEGAVALAPQAGMELQLAQQEQLSALKSLLGALEKTVLLPKVESVQVERTYELVLFYDGRFEVQLGGTDELEYKARYLEEIVVHQLDENKSGLIDLTLEEDGVARLISD